MAMVDLLKGRWPSSKSLPQEITEFFLAKEFNWTLHYIRYVLSMKDVYVLTVLLNLYQRFQAGELTPSSKKPKKGK